MCLARKKKNPLFCLLASKAVRNANILDRFGRQGRGWILFHRVGLSLALALRVVSFQLLLHCCQTSGRIRGGNGKARSNSALGGG